MFAAGAALTAGGVLLGAVGSASAHHPVLTANAACTGIVSYTAEAWLPPDPYNTPDHRTNPDVEVFYQVNGVGADVHVANGAFNQANNFQFSGTFSWPDNASSLLVTAVAWGEWAVGTPGGTASRWSVELQRPDMPCPEETTTTAEVTTTTEQVTTTSTGSTDETSTSVDSGGPTTTSVDSGGPTTTAASGDPTTTAVGAVCVSLPRSGSSAMSQILIATGLILIGYTIVLVARRRPAA